MFIDRFPNYCANELPNSRMLEMIEEVTNIPTFILILTSSLCQITFGYFTVFSIPTLSKLEITTNFGQLLCMSIEGLLPCYYGEKARTAFSELAESIYNMKWYEKDIKFRRAFIIYLQRAQKDVCLLAGNQIPITLTSYLWVISRNLSLISSY